MHLNKSVSLENEIEIFKTLDKFSIYVLKIVYFFKLRLLFLRKVKSLNILFPLRTLKVKKIWIFKNLFFPEFNI